ncbi:hypothetical protein CBOM_01014 [Ceraceosorus bombacis]|uniref:Uncharacterized protein n=1 Tax=Ceraceosorus bombacis TaxID=401625 RepID=A0A0P1BBM5_9BASI|nr:hypothetical protein CBOM_01014 [Ceraceosorus bombacis]
MKVSFCLASVVVMCMCSTVAAAPKVTSVLLPQSTVGQLLTSAPPRIRWINHQGRTFHEYDTELATFIRTDGQQRWGAHPENLPSLSSVMTRASASGLTAVGDRNGVPHEFINGVWRRIHGRI